MPALLSVVFVLLAGFARAQGATGAIEGRVFDASEGSALANVRVVIEGTGTEAVTDESGSFRFNGVRPGDARLVVSYLGLEGQAASVQVRGGETVRHEFQLRKAGRAGEVVTLSAFNVVVDREAGAQAMAMNDQRLAANVKNVVALDEYGDRKGSIGQFLAFLPGVSLNFAGANPTEATMRGFPGEFTNFSVDGAQMSSTFTEGRGQRLEEVSSVNISRVEVTKVPTPDQPASGLGGTINLISRSGFEQKQRRITYDVYGMFHSWQGITFDGGPKGDAPATSPSYVQPSVELTMVQPIGKDFAVSLGYSRYWEHKPTESGTEETDEQATWHLVDLYQRMSQWNSLNQVRIRTSAQIGADWRVTPNDVLTFRYWFQEPILATNRSVLGFNYGAGATGGPRFTQGAATGVGTATMNGSGNNIYNRTRNNVSNLKYRHTGNSWRLDASLGYTDSATDKRDIGRGHFNTTPASIANLIIRGDDIPESGGSIPTRYAATTRTGAAVDLYDGGNYSLNTATSNESDTTMRRLTARLDVARDFALRTPLTLKIGAALDASDRDNRASNMTWDFRPNGSADATARLARNFNVFDDAFNEGGPTLFGRRVRWFSGSKLYDLYRERPAWFVLNQPLAHQNLVTNSREMQEKVTAGYVRGDLRLLDNRLWLVTGVRYERTDVEGRGPANDINALYQRNASGNFVLNNAGQRVLITTDPLAQARLRYQERASRAKNDYDGFYPSLNATYTLTDKLLLRGAYARTVGRPQTSNIIPGTTITAPDVANPTITVSNTGLLPWTADSFDLSLESYQIKDGVGTVGVFHKTIKNFFGNLRTPATAATLAEYDLPNDPVFQGYDLVTLLNSGDAAVRGTEFSYRQSFTFLPPWARGLQVFVNATWLDVEGSNSADFTGFNPRTYAAGISLTRPRYFIKLTYNYQGEIRTGAAAVNAANGIPPETYNYQAEKKRLGVSAQYSFSKRYSVYLSIVDATGYVQDLRRYAPNTPEYAKSSRLQELGYFTTIGVRGTF
jgi:iron complex outermembrane receptor protein